MKMSKPGLCCDQCFQMIAQKSTSSARLWLDLCSIQETCSIFGVRILDQNSASLDALEHMRFITTTDIDELIVVKVHGKREDEQGSFFCGGFCGRE